MLPSARRFRIPLNALVSMGKLEDSTSRGILPANIMDELSTEIFADRWKKIVGEPPAAMLDSRRQMLMLLVESLPVEGLKPMGNLLPPSRYVSTSYSAGR